MDTSTAPDASPHTGGPSRAVAAFLRNLKSVCESDKWSVIAGRTGLRAGRLYTMSWKGREVPKVEDLITVSVRIGVLIDTLVVGIDAKYDELARKLRGVTSDSVQPGAMSYLVTGEVPTVDLPKEGWPMVLSDKEAYVINAWRVTKDRTKVHAAVDDAMGRAKRRKSEPKARSRL